MQTTAQNAADVSVNESYKALRRIIGILGILLPIVLAVWGFGISRSFALQNSISDYYSLRTRDALVGILFVIAWFLFTYKPYSVDGIAGIVGWLFALGVAFFPNSGSSTDGLIHFSSAIGLFLTLSFFSLFLFTKGTESPQDFRGTISSFRFGAIKSNAPEKRQKKKRNRVYVICGLIILGCIITLSLYYAFWQKSVLSSIKPVFWLETIMVWAFGFSWLVKGETLWRDPTQKTPNN
jgi:hypothetical protein